MENPQPNLFRLEAQEHHRHRAEGGALLKVSPPWTWALLCAVLAALAIAVTGSIIGSVEVNSRAMAVLRPTDGVRILTSLVAGTVSAVHIRSGQAIEAGGMILSIDAPIVQGQLLEAQRQVDLQTSDFDPVSDLQRRLHIEQEGYTQARIAKMTDQIASHRASLAGFARKAKSMQALAEEGMVSQIAVVDAMEMAAQAKRQLVGAELELALGRQELAAMESRRHAEVWQQQQTLQIAHSRRDALLLALKQTVIEAPQDGTVEALLAEPGDVVRPGQVVGKLIPTGAPLRVVSFLPEKDRAFVKVGGEVRLELNQLPYGEYGTLGARVVRISDDLASLHEVQEALGEAGTLDGPTFRVELEITDTAAAETARIKLRSGMLMQARFTLRRQRLITMVLEPLRRWLQ